MNIEKTLIFLKDLSANNSLDWMKSHRAEYLEAKSEFAALIQDFIRGIAVYDPSIAFLQAEDLIFRLNRDTRFSKDKSPYHTAFRAHISTAAKKPIPVGYYISISPGNSFLGGGLFASQFPQATRMVRDYIIQHEQELQSILNAPEFNAHFVLEGETLKNVPRGYDKECPLAEYIKHKSWHLTYHLSDQQLLEGELSYLTELFQKMKPLNDFLNRALDGFTMPQH